MNNIPRNLLPLLLALLTCSLMAQPTNCITFDEPEVGTIFNESNTDPGAVIYQYEGSNLIMNTFTDQQNQNWFDQIQVTAEGVGNNEPPALFVNYAVATFEFITSVNTLCFTGFLSGHEINFGINGEIGVFENLLDPNIQQEWPNYDINISSAGNEPGSPVSVCIFGPLESFTIGGIEFLLDDVCTDLFTTCSFNDPNLQAFCSTTGSPYVSVDFGSIVGNNEFVDVFVDGEFQGFYPIEAFPIIIDGLNPTAGQEAVTITVCINDDPNCCYTETVLLPNCTNTECITFNEPEIGTTFSAETGVEPGDIIYQYPAANMSMGIFASANGELNFDQIQVVEGWVDNLDTPSLYINYSTATFSYHTPVQTLCFTGYLSGHEINFGLNGNVELFTSLIDPALAGAFPDFDITVAQSEPNSNGLVSVCISGIIETFTIGGIEFLLDDLCTSDPICDISNLQVGQYACDPDVEPHLFYLNFDHNQSAADSFQLFVNGDLYETFTYGDLPILEIPVATNVAHFLVADLHDDGCAEDLTVEVQNCDNACDGFAATTTDVYCVEAEAYGARVVFSTPPTGQIIRLFSLTTNELVDLATYNNSSGVSFIIDGAGDPEGYLLVDDLTGCQTTLPPFDFDPGSCSECDVFITAIEPTDCNPNGVYSVYLDIETTAPWLQYTVMVGEDQVYGPFSAEEFPMTVGSIIGTPGVVTTVVVSGPNNACAVWDNVSQDCTNPCDNFSATLNGVECLSPNNILVSFNLNGVEPGEPIRITNANGGFIEELIFEENPLLVDFTPIAGSNVLLIEAQELGCETILDYPIPPDCPPQCGEYDIYNVFCENQTNQVAVIGFIAIGPEGEVFTVQVGNEIYEFTYGNVEYELVINNSNTAIFELLFSQPGSNCFTSLSAENPCYNSCQERFDIVEIYCSDGAVAIQFFAEGPAGQLFFVAVDDQIFTFEYGQNIYDLTVAVDSNIASFQYVFFDEVDGCEVPIWVDNPCLNTCENFVVEAVQVSCEGPDSLNVILIFDGIEPGEPLRITTNHLPNFVVERTYNNDPIQISIPVAGVEVFAITVQAQGINCDYSLTVEVPQDCLGICENFGAEIISTTCLDSPFVGLEIRLFGVDTDGRNIIIQNPESGVFYTVVLDENPFFLPWPVNDDGVLLITDPETGCSTEIDYETPPDCVPECGEQFDVVEVYCSDDGVPVFLFTADGPEGLPFFVQVAGEEYAFTYGESLYDLALNNIIPNTFTYELRFVDQQTGCVEEILVDNPCFCFIEILAVETTECDANGNYFVAMDISAGTSWGNGIFIVEAEGYTVTIEEGSSSVTIGPFDGGPVEITITEAFTGACTEQVTVDQNCEPICETYDLVIEGTECDANGNYFLDVTFESNVNGPFVVFNEPTGESIVTTVADLPVQFGPYNIQEIQTSLIIVFLEETNGCTIEDIYVQECQPICPTIEVYAEPTPCDDNGQYSVIVGIGTNVSGLFTVTHLNTDEVVENVPNSQFPITFGPYDAEEVPFGEFELLFEDGVVACEYFADYVTDCPPNGECGFNNIFAEAYECVDGEFMVDIEFDNPAGGPLGFYIFGDGMIFGPYQYGETFYTFGPLDGSEEEHDILFLDIANPACFGDYTLDYVCSDECNITEVIAEVTECDGEVFGVELDVVGSNLGGQFIVVGNGNNYGTFSYADLPIFLGPFEGDNETVYEFGVIDLLNPTCTNFTEVGPINCQPCEIRDFTYEVDCGEDFYAVTVDFIYENPESDGFRLFIGNDEVATFSYDGHPWTVDLPYTVEGSTIRVEDFSYELCGETIDFEIPCCSLGNILNEFEVTDCEDDGEYFFVVNNFEGGNLGDSLVITYAPAGSSIIATEVVSYGSLPVEIGPLSGDGATAYIVVLADQDNSCAVTTTVEPVYCDNNACVEFEGVEGVFGPLLGHPDGEIVAEENQVAISYEENPVTECSDCFLFITDGIPGIDFGEGQIVATENSGVGLNFEAVSSAFNTVSVEFYYPDGGFTVAVNGADPVTVDNIVDLPTIIAPGVELQVSFDANDQTKGVLTFSGENIEQINLYSNESSGFDNVCLSLDDNVWPGDTNSDNVANSIDLLSIGLTYGFSGPARVNMNTEWAGLISQNWAGDFANGLNHKHADANGDGVIDELDEEVLQQNYGLLHGPVGAFEELPYTDLDPPVFVNLDGADQLPAGTNVQIPVVAGAADQMIDDIYGLAFTVQIDPELFDMSSLEVIYPTSWFGEPGINTTHIHRVYPDGRIEVALSRTDHNNVSGFGPIMYFRIIIDDIAGVHEIPTTLVVDNILAIDHDEQRLTMRPGVSEVLLTETKEGMDRDELISTFGIFPNPTLDVVYFKNAYNLPPNRLDLFNAAGQQLASIKEPGMQFDLSGYPAGVYMLQIHLEGQIFTERLVKLE